MEEKILKYTKQLLCMLLFIPFTAITSCDETEMELNKGNNPLTLTASTKEVELDIASPEKQVIGFNWTSGTNNGTNAAISYVFQMDLAGNGFQGGISDSLGKAVLTRTFKSEDLNVILLDTFGIAVGTEAILEARVIATIHSDEPVQDTTEVVQLTATPFKPLSKTLFLLGDATPNGWNAGSATPMTYVSGTAGGFTWSGKMVAGKFKFITKRGQFIPSYNKGATDEQLYFRESDGDNYDEQFEITEGATYRVQTDLLNLTISVEKLSSAPYAELWMTGDATPGGWDNQLVSPMFVDPADPFIFHYNEVLTSGEFKIATEKGTNDCKFYRPTVENANITQTNVQLSTTPDYKWKITNAGPYKIILDIGKPEIRIQPFTPYAQLWIIGDATPNGWSDGAPNPMTKSATNPYIFTYEGPLNAGEFKFPTAIGTGWACAYFMPGVNGEGTASTRMTFVEKGGPDRKWKITTAGYYKIEINQFYETISITKQ